MQTDLQEMKNRIIEGEHFLQQEIKSQIEHANNLHS